MNLSTPATTLNATQLDDLSLALGEIAGQLRDRGSVANDLADVFELMSSKLYRLSLSGLDIPRPMKRTGRTFAGVRA